MFSAAGALHQGDHAVEKRLAGIGGDTNLIRSESTLVPPVTALRSPPDSRMTGADSPVIDRFVYAGNAFDDVAVTRNNVIGFAHHHVALAQLRGGNVSILPFPKLLGLVSVLVLRRRSACALPRPSAMASAKLANSTVNHSHRQICT